MRSLFKFLVILTSLMMATYSFSQEGDKEVAEEEKIYTKSEFEKALKEQVAKKAEEEVERRLSNVVPKKLVGFSKELLEKEKKLQEVENNLKVKEIQLELNQKSFGRKVLDLQKKQKKVLGCIDKNNKEAQSRVDHLVKVISNMKPANAAKVLSAQDSDLSVKILGTIDAVKAAKIFNLMDKEVSARLQKQYATMTQ